MISEHILSCVISEISSMISYMISRCVYPPLITRLVNLQSGDFDSCSAKCSKFCTTTVEGDLAPVSRRSGCATVIWRSSREGVARLRRPTDPDRRFAMSCVLVRRPQTSGLPPHPTRLPRRPTESAQVDAPAMKRRRPPRRWERGRPLELQQSC
jgi:hypothetical protein